MVKVIKVTKFEEVTDTKTVGEYSGFYPAKCVAQALAGVFDCWYDGKLTYYVLEGEHFVAEYYNRAEWLKKKGVSYDEWQALEHSSEYDDACALKVMLGEKGIYAEEVINDYGEWVLPEVVMISRRKY